MRASSAPFGRGSKNQKFSFLSFRFSAGGVGGGVGKKKGRGGGGGGGVQDSSLLKGSVYCTRTPGPFAGAPAARQADRIGPEGEGFRAILHGMNPERILIAAEAVGIGRAALRKAGVPRAATTP